MGTYTKDWDSKSVPNGVHNIHAVISDFSGNLGTTPAVSFSVDNTVSQTLILQSQISVHSASNNIVEAVNVLDGNTASRWALNQGWPQYIILNLGNTYNVVGLRHHEDWSHIGNYEIYVSTDAVNWGLPVKTGVVSTLGQIDLTFPKKVGKYVKVTYLSSSNGGSYCYTSELNVFEDGSGPIAVSDPPLISVGSNNTVLPAGTTQFQLTCQTNKNATCKFSTVAGTSFAEMSDTFSSTGGLVHSTTVGGLVDGKAYTYYIRSMDELNNVNTTDYPISFSVANADTAPVASITVLAPDGGENLKLDRVKSFYWNSYGITGDIKLEISRNGGSTYQTLFITANSGSANWVVTGPRSGNCKVRFSSVDNPQIFDTSKGNFKIS